MAHLKEVGKDDRYKWKSYDGRAGAPGRLYIHEEPLLSTIS